MNTFDHLKMIKEAKDIQELDQTLWNEKCFTGGEEYKQQALKDLHMVIEGDRIAFERIKKKHGAI